MEALNLGMAIQQLKFVDQYLSTLADIQSMLVGYTVKDGLGEAIAKVSNRLPTLRLQLGRATKQAEIIGSAASSLELQGACELMEASVQQLSEALQTLCSTHEIPDRQAAAAGEITKIAAGLKEQLGNFRNGFTGAQETALVKEARRDLVDYMVLEMQADIEGLLYSIRRWEQGVSKEATTSKQRTHLRSKAADGRKTLERKIKNYNKFVEQLTSRPPQIVLEAGLKGDLPWYFQGLDGQGAGVTFKEKMDITEKYQWLLRCREQKALVLQQMEGYVVYYQTLLGQLWHAIDTWAGCVEGLSWVMMSGLEFGKQQLEKAAPFTAATGRMFDVDTYGEAVHQARADAAELAARHIRLVGGLRGWEDPIEDASGAGGGGGDGTGGGDGGGGSGGAECRQVYLLASAVTLAKMLQEQGTALDLAEMRGR